MRQQHLPILTGCVAELMHMTPQALPVILQRELTLPFILDERGRELYYEAHRRTDLIRHGKFTTSAYLWAWKGGVAGGTQVDSKYNIFPIPSTDLSSNPNLVQNPGY